MGTEGEGLRVALVITAMGCGGAEGQLARLAGYLGQRHRVRVYVLHGGEVFYPLPPQVDVIPFSGGGATLLGRGWRRWLWLRRGLTGWPAQVVVSFIDVANVYGLLAATRSLPVIVSERSEPRWRPLPFSYRVARRLLYRFAARLVVQTEGLRGWAQTLAAAHRVVVLPNPVFPVPLAKPEAGDPRLVAVGRLDPVKGFRLLVEVFGRLAPRFLGWKLVIYGEGEERAGLEAQVHSLGLGPRVELPGTVRDPAAHLQKGDVFVLPSRYEGFPNALAEAMAAGVAVVAFDCPGGPRQLIRHGVDGLLVPPGDSEALAAALARLMADPGERQRLAARAPEVVRRFPADEILGAWERLCREVVAERRAG